MTLSDATISLDAAQVEAQHLFEEALGISNVPVRIERVGDVCFLKFVVGRRAPIYDHALQYVQKRLPDSHPFKGLVSLDYVKPFKFPESQEASVLLTMLTRSTRHVVGGQEPRFLSVSFVPFQNREDDKVTQRASHLIVGRRGVGKSTLISRAVEQLLRTGALCAVVDMQAYGVSTRETVIYDVVGDVARCIVDSATERMRRTKESLPTRELSEFASKVVDNEIAVSRIAPEFRRLLQELTKALKADVFLFLDDFHVIDRDLQPLVLHLVHGALKGAGGWLKVAGLRSLLNAYDPASRQGIQTPGDAQLISLDLTLVDPHSAEEHLRAILLTFLRLIGVQSTREIIDDAALRRLVWANAGVPRDFLEMVGRSLEHSRRSKRAKITLTDANLAIGEFGQRKLDDMEKDARNEEKRLRNVVDYLEDFCLDKHKVNAFLIRSDASAEREAIQILSDLRIVHLIHQATTPHKAGERYEAFLIDYSLFTGFRRRPNIKEMLPADDQQYKAKELREIPTLPRNFMRQIGDEESN